MRSAEIASVFDRSLDATPIIGDDGSGKLHFDNTQVSRVRGSKDASAGSKSPGAQNSKYRVTTTLAAFTPRTRHPWRGGSPKRPVGYRVKNTER